MTCLSSENIVLRNASFFTSSEYENIHYIQHGKEEDGAVSFLDVLGWNVTEDDSI